MEQNDAISKPGGILAKQPASSVRTPTQKHPPTHTLHSC